jgi:hypothetical protein
MMEQYARLSQTILSLGHLRGILSIDPARWRFGSPCLAIPSARTSVPYDSVPFEKVSIKFANINYFSIRLTDAVQELLARTDIWLYRRWRRIMMGEFRMLPDLLAGYAHRLPPWMERSQRPPLDGRGQRPPLDGRGMFATS